MANPSVHKGHRQRLKARFLDTGLDSFTDVQALELLLFYAIVYSALPDMLSCFFLN